MDGRDRSGGSGKGLRRVPVRVVVAVVAASLFLPPGLPARAAEPPQIRPDTAEAVRGSAVDVPVLANDSLGDPPPEGVVGLAITVAPTRGEATVEDPDGTGPEPPFIRYVADTGASVGDDTLDYDVTVSAEVGAPVTVLGSSTLTVAVLNAAPVAGPDSSSVTSAAGATVVVPVLANDTDADGGTLAVVEVAAPPHGSAAVVPGGVLYDPVDDYVGTDGFTYVVADGQGGSAIGDVQLDVQDATVPMVLHPDSLTATAGTGVSIDVLANDESGGRDPLVVVAAGPADSGATVVAGADGRTVTYTAGTGIAGADRFTYRVRDRRGNEAVGEVSVTVEAPPPPPPPPPPAPAPDPSASVAPSPAPTSPTRTVNISVSGPLARRHVRYSYRPGCPVAPSQLRRMRVNYWNFKGKVRRGTLIVHRSAVADLSRVFTEAFEGRFRIKKMRKVDVYYKKGRRSPTASDMAAMRAGNTSAFNCRPVVGNPTKRSAHSYGIAVDINTIQNPYVTGRTFYPRKGRKYLRRSRCRKGMVCPGGVIATAMRDRGWYWGARWSNPDYQHFSANGG